MIAANEPRSPLRYVRSSRGYAHRNVKYVQVGVGVGVGVGMGVGGWVHLRRLKSWGGKSGFRSSLGLGSL